MLRFKQSKNQSRGRAPGKKSAFLIKMDPALPRLRRNLRTIGKQIRTLPSRIRRTVRRGLERIFARFRRSRDPQWKQERFQRSIEKIFGTKRRGSSRGADESSGFISDEEELDDVTPDYSSTELEIQVSPVKPGSLSAETDAPIEIEMIVLK